MPAFRHSSSLRVHNEHASLKLSATHCIRVQIDNHTDAIHDSKYALSTSLDVYSCSDLVIEISVFENGQQLESENIKQSLFVCYLVHYMRLNSAGLCINNISETYTDGNEKSIKVNVTPRRSLTTHATHIRSTWASLVSIHLVYYCTAPGHDDMSAPLYNLLSISTEKFFARHIVKRYPLIFGTWGDRLEKERALFPIVARSILSIAERSSNDEFHKKIGRNVNIMRRRLDSTERFIHHLLRKACFETLSEQPISADTWKQISEEEVICLSLERLFKISRPPALFKGKCVEKSFILSQRLREVTSKSTETIGQNLNDMGTNNPRENAFDRNETKIDGCIIDWPAPLLSQTLLETEPSFISTLDEEASDLDSIGTFGDEVLDSSSSQQWAADPSEASVTSSFCSWTAQMNSESDSDSILSLSLEGDRCNLAARSRSNHGYGDESEQTNKLQTADRFFPLQSTATSLSSRTAYNNPAELLPDSYEASEYMELPIEAYVPSSSPSSLLSGSECNRPSDHCILHPGLPVRAPLVGEIRTPSLTCESSIIDHGLQPSSARLSHTLPVPTFARGPSMSSSLASGNTQQQCVSAVEPLGLEAKAEFDVCDFELVRGGSLSPLSYLYSPSPTDICTLCKSQKSVGDMELTTLLSTDKCDLINSPRDSLSSIDRLRHENLHLDAADEDDDFFTFQNNVCFEVDDFLNSHQQSHGDIGMMVLSLEKEWEDMVD